VYEKYKFLLTYIRWIWYAHQLIKGGGCIQAWLETKHLPRVFAEFLASFAASIQTIALLNLPQLRLVMATNQAPLTCHTPKLNLSCENIWLPAK